MRIQLTRISTGDVLAFKPLSGHEMVGIDQLSIGQGDSKPPVPVLPPDEALAVVAYTFDLGEDSECATGDKNLHYPTTMFLLKPFMTHLMRGLSTLPPLSTMVFRGIPAHSFNNVQANYTQGRAAKWTGFTSTTTDITRAHNFAYGPGGFIFRITVFSGRFVLPPLSLLM